MLNDVREEVQKIAAFGGHAFLFDGFLFDNDGLERYELTLAVYSVEMMRPLLRGDFETAALRPHPAHKNVVGFYHFQNGLWGLMTPRGHRWLATWPEEIAQQKAFSCRKRIGEFYLRGVHEPLPVLPRVLVMFGWSREKLQVCMSCNVCRLCHKDAFTGRLRRNVERQYGFEFWCKCAKWECDGCKKELGKDAFSRSRWRHRKLGSCKLISNHYADYGLQDNGLQKHT